jgi:hypothetical protein
MIRAGMLSYTGGLAVVVLLLITANLLKWLGISPGEALYLSVLGLTVIGYGMVEWRLRKKG